MPVPVGSPLATNVVLQVEVLLGGSRGSRGLLAGSIEAATAMGQVPEPAPSQIEEVFCEQLPEQPPEQDELMSVTSIAKETCAVDEAAPEATVVAKLVEPEIKKKVSQITYKMENYRR